MNASPAAVRSAGVSTGRVLGVDDYELARHFLRGHLVRLGYEAEIAASVAEAQALIEAKPTGWFDCVVTDYQMPGLTGLDLIAWLSTHDPTVATIMITAAGEKDVVTETLRSGASDYLDKPFRAADLNAALSTAIATTRRRRDLAKTEADAHAVARIQQRLLGGQRGDLPGGVEVCHYPMRGAGGDFLNVFELDADHLLVLGADVSGHDLKAAFISAYFQGIVRGMLEKQTPVTEILTFFNHCLVREWNALPSHSRELATSLSVCAAVIDRVENTLTLLNSGFPALYRIDASGIPHACGEGGGNPLGWFEDSEPEQIQMPLPDTGELVFWTDGLEEHAAGLEVSSWSLAHALYVHGSENPSARVASAPDDILVARVPLGTPMRGRCPLLSEHYHGGHADEIDELQAFWQRSLKLAIPAIDQDALFDILLCLREAVLNALIHGCGRRADQFARLDAVLDTASSLLCVTVFDPGPGHHFDWQRHAENASEYLLSEHRGLALLHHFATRVETARNGATLYFEIPCPHQLFSSTKIKRL